MVRIACFTKVAGYALYAVALIFASGCTGIQDLGVKASKDNKPNLLNIYVSRGDVLTPTFTTKNRPKKATEIGGREFEVFDPSVDKDFLEIYEEFLQGCMNSDENSCHQIRRYVEYNHFLQSLDIVKAGCSVFKRTNGAVYYFYPKNVEGKKSDYPDGYYNPFPNYKYNSIYWPRSFDFEKKRYYYEVNGNSFFKTSQTKVTSTFFTSEDAELGEAFAFECLELR